MEFENRVVTTFNQANTKRPEEITLREEVMSSKLPRLEFDDDFGGLYPHRCLSWVKSYFCSQNQISAEVEAKFDIGILI